MTAKDFTYFSIRSKDGQLEVLDQRKLPDVEEWLAAKDPESMSQYIKQLSVRGAPLIGIPLYSFLPSLDLPSLSFRFRGRHTLSHC
jgi:hypothetical protein